MGDERFECESQSEYDINWPRALLIAVSFSLFVVAIAWFSGYRDAPETIDRILQASPAHVQSITIRPSGYASLMTVPVRITDRERIRRFVYLARGAHAGDADHPQAKWRCHISVEDSTGVSHCTVTRTLFQGTLIAVHTRRNDGLILGTYRCDDLAPFLEQLVEVAHGEFVERKNEE